MRGSPLHVEMMALAWSKYGGAPSELWVTHPSLAAEAVAYVGDSQQADIPQGDLAATAAAEGRTSA
jgi:hypothetical protein